jgi:hypothetical protein
MTDEERSNPAIIDSIRLLRIAVSSGTQPGDVERFLAQFDQVLVLMRQLASMSLWQRIKMITGIGKLPGQDGLKQAERRLTRLQPPKDRSPAAGGEGRAQKLRELEHKVESLLREIHNLRREIQPDKQRSP